VLRRWEISTSLPNIESLRGKIAEEEKRARQEASNTAVRDEYNKFVESQQGRMVSGDPFSWVVRELSLLAEAHQITVVSLRPGSVAQHSRRPRFNTFSARLELTGTYDQIGKFVVGFENQFSTAEVRSLAIAGGSPGQEQLRAELELIFLIKPELATASATTKKSS
jgi:hypothetical protein